MLLNIRSLIALIFVSLLSACGGGGGGGGGGSSSGGAAQAEPKEFSVGVSSMSVKRVSNGEDVIVATGDMSSETLMYRN